MKKFICMVSILVFSIMHLGSETLSLTIDDAIKMALSNNLDLQKSGISLKETERAKLTAWNSFLPSILLSAGLSAKHGIFQFENSSPTGMGDPGNIGFNSGLALTLPLNVAIGPAAKKLKMDYEAGLLDYEDAIEKLIKEVQKTFYNILANQEDIRIQQANIDLAKKRYTQTLEDFQSGLVPELDVLTAEVSLLKLQPALNSAVQTYSALVLQFKSLIGVLRTDMIELAGELPTELYDLDAEELVSKYAASRLDLRSLDKQIMALKLSKQAVDLNANTPTLTLGYNYAFSGSNAETSMTLQAIEPWSNWGDLGTLSLGLRWKLDGLIPGSKTNVNSKKLQDSIDSLRIQQEITRQAAETEITNLAGNLGIYRLTIEANTSGVALAKKKYELTDEAYRVGTRQLLDVESAQNEYMTAQQQLLLARYNYIATLLDLEYALGTPMHQFLKK